jgi:hypothetical protein
MTALERLRGPLTLPNFITLLRLAALPFFLFSIAAGRLGIALIIFVMAGISDGIDGCPAVRHEVRARRVSRSDRRQAADDGSYLFLAVPSFPPLSRCPSGWPCSWSPGILLMTVGLLMILSSGVRQFPPTWLSEGGAVT